jgi:fluoroquinolone resistance protein
MPQEMKQRQYRLSFIPLVACNKSETRKSPDFPRCTMSDPDSEDKYFQGKAFIHELIPKGDYENCSFDNCRVANSDLSDFSFTDCVFRNCDFSMANLANTAFRGIVFIDCKLLGARFEHCNAFGFSVRFESCRLKLASFYKLNAKKSIFTDCDLSEIDFTEANLAGSVFDNCGLSGSVFHNTILENADFRTSYHFSIDPETNRIRKAKFSMAGIAGLLDKYNIEIE